MTQPDKKVMYIMVCAAGPAADAGRLVDIASHNGWDCHVLTTPAAADFLDTAALEHQTGHPVRTTHRAPGEPRSNRPRADVVVIAPATYNTVNKLAAGISDNYALDIVNECLGAGVPTVILPFVNTALAARTPYQRALTALRDEGIHIIPN
ncbi:MAG: flavoprotein, partial [Stackebrandtia sp.]